MPVSARAQGGFTLVEVVLAVAVLAMAMVALSQTLGASAVAYRSIDDTRQAYLVAADKLVEMQVYQQWPDTGSNEDVVSRAERDWWVTTAVESGPYPDTRRVDIEVGEIIDDDERPMMYTLSSLVGKPPEETGLQGQGGQGGEGGESPSNQDLTGGGG